MINAYSVWLKGDEKNASVIYAATGAKARADYWRHVKELFESPRKMWCLLRSKRLKTEEQRPNLKRTAELRNIPFVYAGMKVMRDGEVGYIVDGNSDANLDVYFPFGRNGRRGVLKNCHPFWKMRYFKEDGTEIEVRDEKEEDSRQAMV
jgi:hypothetical protein